jgi:predicted HAD superfamily Cof-like phosphohydrolase
MHLLSPGNPTINWKDIGDEELERVVEEYEELRGAVDEHDALGVLKEMCDLLYVLYGMAVTMGIDLEPFWEAVHASNMLKTPVTDLIKGESVPKPPGWVRPDLKKVLFDEYGIDSRILNNGGFPR